MTPQGRLWNAWMAKRAERGGVYPNGKVMPARWQDLPRSQIYALAVVAAFPGRGAD